MATIPAAPQKGQALPWSLQSHVKLQGGYMYNRRCEEFGITWWARKMSAKAPAEQEFAADHLGGQVFKTMRELLDAWDAPQHHQGRLYQPSNGTEGDSFYAAWCAGCQRGEEARAAGGDCSILLRTMAFDVGDADYPREWQYDANDSPTCLAFVPLGDKVPPAPCRHTADMFPTTKGPTMNTTPAPTTTEHLLPDPVQLQSSQLTSMAYDPERELLEILFIRGGLYRYAGVPAWKVERISTAGIRGASTSGEFRALIRDDHPTTKHNPTTGTFDAVQPARVTQAQLDLLRKLVKKAPHLGQRLGDGWDAVQQAAGKADNDAIPADVWLAHLTKAEASRVIEHLKGGAA